MQLLALTLLPALASAGLLPISIGLGLGSSGSKTTTAASSKATSSRSGGGGGGLLGGLGGLLGGGSSGSGLGVLGIPIGQLIPSPTGITITSASYSGSGCPSGSVSTSLSSDKTVITLGFNEFDVYIGPGTTTAQHSENCNILLTLSYPAGYAFNVASTTYHGFALLDSGVTGKFASQFSFQSLSGSKFGASTTVVGGGSYAAGDVYTTTSSIGVSSLTLSPCGVLGGITGLLGSLTPTVFSVQNTLSLTSTSSTASGQMTDDDMTTAVSTKTSQQLKLNWVAC